MFPSLFNVFIISQSVSRSINLYFNKNWPIDGTLPTHTHTNKREPKTIAWKRNKTQKKTNSSALY